MVRQSGGAAVSAVTECKKDTHFRYVQEVKTAADGSFYMPPSRTSGCSRMRLSASKVEDFWLKTGHDVFYEGDNGTTPLVDVPWAGSPTKVEIMLGSRGGLVSFRVWDTATNRFIYAGLHLTRRPVPSKGFGSMEIATGHDGSPDTLLLPAGRYEVFVQHYSCGEADYFAASTPRETFTVEAGKKLAKDISVDIRRIKPKSSYANPGAEPCKP